MAEPTKLRELTEAEKAFFERYGLACSIVPNILAEAVQELADELKQFPEDPLISQQAQSWNQLRFQPVGNERIVQDSV